MERIISRIDDVKMAEAIIEFANKLGLSVAPDIDEAGIGNYLTTGSKKHNLNWIRNKNFAENKVDGDIIWTLCGSNDASDIVKALVEEYLDNHFDNNDIDDSDDDDVELDTTPSTDVIFNLYNKVKGQKKSPKNYNVVLRDGNWVATATGEVGYGNLDSLYKTIC